MSQMGERDISKMDEPILMQVGISGPRGNFLGQDVKVQRHVRDA